MVQGALGSQGEEQAGVGLHSHALQVGQIGVLQLGDESHFGADLPVGVEEVKSTLLHLVQDGCHISGFPSLDEKLDGHFHLSQGSQEQSLTAVK